MTDTSEEAPRVPAPRLRAFNANLLMVAVDAGFFAGPFLGGLIMAGGFGHGLLFGAGGAMMFAAALCVRPAARRMRQLGLDARS